MRFQSLAEMNAYHQTFYSRQKQQVDALLDRPYIQRRIRRLFVRKPLKRRPLSPTKALERLRSEPPFEAQILGYAEQSKTTGLVAQNRKNACQPRRKAAGSGLSRRQLVKTFASQPEFASKRTKELWYPFFDELKRLGLEPRKANHGDTYEYAGKCSLLSISFRQFEKLVSELTPRRVNR